LIPLHLYTSSRTIRFLPAKYQFLKGMDAFQLVLSINEKCGRFITNDKKLKRVTEIDVKTMEDL